MDMNLKDKDEWGKKITVGELIEELRKYPTELTVVIHDGEYSQFWDTISVCRIRYYGGDEMIYIHPYADDYLEDLQIKDEGGVGVGVGVGGGEENDELVGDGDPDRGVGIVHRILDQDAGGDGEAGGIDREIDPRNRDQGRRNQGDAEERLW